MAQCCDLCLAHPSCDTAELHVRGESLVSTERGYACALKTFDARLNITRNPARVYKRVTREPFTNDELCAKNTGTLAVQNMTSQIDVFVYNHAAFADEIVTCAVAVSIPEAFRPALASASVRRIDETHANPLNKWIEMGAPDYTNAAQNAAILAASELHAESLTSVASIDGLSFTITMGPHSVAAVRLLTHEVLAERS